MSVILASASPRRRELLKIIFPDFSVIPAQGKECIREDIGIEFAPVFLAAEKAREIAKDHPSSLVIGCDTVVIFENELLGKPRDEADAFRMLSRLSGQTHKVITGCSLCLNGEMHSFSEETLVSFYPLSKEEITAYIQTGEPMDKAGAYGIQERGALLAEKIEGDYFNIVGLPIARLKREIEVFLKDLKTVN